MAAVHLTEFDRRDGGGRGLPPRCFRTPSGLQLQDFLASMDFFCIYVCICIYRKLFSSLFTLQELNSAANLQVAIFLSTFQLAPDFIDVFAEGTWLSFI